MVFEETKRKDFSSHYMYVYNYQKRGKEILISSTCARRMGSEWASSSLQM